MKDRKKEILIISIILVIQTIIFTIVGVNKEYIHMDEAYSLGLANYDKVEIQENEDFYNQWHNGEYYEDYLAVQEKDIGQYKQVYENQKNDVHPPIYYLLLRIGDRVMQIKNNYDMTWEKRNGDSLEIGNGVFNGETGTITNINEKEKNIRVKFDDEKVCWYQFNELEQLEHSYCITIHKAQGSEFDVVIMIIPQAAPMLLTRNLLYTGLTRAKKLLIVIGNDRIVDYMIKNVDSKKRNTGLEFKLKK